MVLRLDEVKVLLAFLAIGLLIYSVIDCSRTPEAAVPSTLPRSGWFVVMILLPILGPIFWLVASRTDEDSKNSRPNPRDRRPGRGGPPHGPLGPDDDPDFLHGL
jgi:ABC-type transport system involved in cytochrome c biogenesis permease component